MNQSLQTYGLGYADGAVSTAQRNRVLRNPGRRQPRRLTGAAGSDEHAAGYLDSLGIDPTVVL